MAWLWPLTGPISIESAFSSCPVATKLREAPSRKIALFPFCDISKGIAYYCPLRAFPYNKQWCQPLLGSPLQQRCPQHRRIRSAAVSHELGHSAPHGVNPRCFLLLQQQHYSWTLRHSSSCLGLNSKVHDLHDEPAPSKTSLTSIIICTMRQTFKAILIVWS